MSSYMPQRPVPAWVTVIIIIAMLPATAFTVLLANCPVADSWIRGLLWCYPFYVLLTAWLARASWSQRPYMTWILIALMLLTHAAAWGLVILDH